MDNSDNPERQERILNAAIKLIIRFGYDKTTVSDIAQEAGVSKGAIYLHWKSKEDLFDALVWREIDHYMDELVKRIEADPEGGTLFGMYKHSLLVLADYPFIQALYRKDRLVLGDFMRRSDGIHTKQRYGIGAEFLRQMQAAGVIRSDPGAEVLAYVFNCFTFGLFMIDTVIPADEAPPVEATIGAMTDILSRALTPADGGNSEAGKQVIREMLALIKAQRAAGQM